MRTSTVELTKAESRIGIQLISKDVFCCLNCGQIQPIRQAVECRNGCSLDSFPLHKFYNQSGLVKIGFCAPLLKELGPPDYVATIVHAGKDYYYKLWRRERVQKYMIDNAEWFTSQIPTAEKKGEVNG